MKKETIWTNKIHSEIPLTHAMGLTITKLTTVNIHLNAPLTTNKNGHKTAFAGSIYTLGITAGWTLLSYITKQMELNTLVVAGSANIKYRQPIKADLYGQCEIQPEISSKLWLNDWSKNKNATQSLKIRVGGETSTSAVIDATFFLLRA